MNELIGIKSLFTMILNPSMKRELLMFDKVGIPDYSQASNMLPDYFRDEYDLLLDRGLIFEAEDPVLEISNNLEERVHIAEKALRTFKEGGTEYDTKQIQQVTDDIHQMLELFKSKKKIKQIRETESNSIISSIAIDNLKAQGILTRFGYLEGEFLSYFIEFESWARTISILLREIKGVKAFPILALETNYLEKPEPEKADVISIVLNALPIPNESTSWEQILDYRNDSDAISNFLALRDWMNDVAKAKLSQDEIEDKLRYLIDRYQRYIKLHEMKVDTGVLETIVVASAEFLENLMKFKWGEIAKGLFSIRHRRIALIEGELTAPGNEIAYIVKTRNAFTR